MSQLRHRCRLRAGRLPVHCHACEARQARAAHSYKRFTANCAFSRNAIEVSRSLALHWRPRATSRDAAPASKLRRPSWYRERYSKSRGPLECGSMAKSSFVGEIPRSFPGGARFIACNQ